MVCFFGIKVIISFFDINTINSKLFTNDRKTIPKVINENNKQLIFACFPLIDPIRN